MGKVRNVYIAHTINRVANSVVGVYIPAYLLTLGFPLSRVILYFVISHGVGLIFTLAVLPILIKRWGLLHTFKLYYPLQIIALLLLIALKTYHLPPEVAAIFDGLATFAYWTPLNIFFIKHAQEKDMGSSLSKFFALPSLFGILGPLLGALFILFVGFWPVFVLTVIGILASFIPLSRLGDTDVTLELTFSSAIERLKTNKSIFLFEFFDNIIEESEWFWGIYVFVIIGSLATPGIVGSLQAMGGSLFTLFIGKYVNKYGRKLIPVIAIGLLIINILRVITHQPISAYFITLVASFVLNMFLVSYFATIYKTVKNNKEEEFMILREIATVGGRMVVFAAIFICLHFLQFFFLLPIVVIIMLLVLFLLKRSVLAR